jgi:hypothetical protein
MKELTKILCLSYYSLCFLFNKIGKEGRIVYAWNWGVGGVGRGGTNNVYTYK